MILIFVIIGSAFADKLDRGYLPPPTYKFSGGNADIIELPYEYAKTMYNLQEEHPKLLEIATKMELERPKNFFFDKENIYSALNDSSSDSESDAPNKYEDQDQNIGVSLNLPSASSLLVNEFSNNEKDHQFISSAVPITNSDSILTDTSPNRIQDEVDRKAGIINFDNVLTPDGYYYNFDTSNKIHADEIASSKNGVKAKGSYSYLGDDGKTYTVTYTADENGFQPQGDHLPTSPPIPDAILKVIEQAYKEKVAGIIDDGSYDDKKYGYRKYHRIGYKGYSSENKKERTSTFIKDLKNKGSRNNDFNDYSNETEASKNPLKSYKVSNNLKDNPVGLLDYSQINAKDATRRNTSLGYQYSTPKYVPNDFTSRFSDITNFLTETPKEMITTTRKPFLTPYVTLNDERNVEEYFEDPPFDNSVNVYNEEESYNGKYYNDSQHQEVTDSYENVLVPNNEEYYGMKIMDLDKKFKEPLINDLLLNNSSEFPTRFTNVQSNIIYKPQTNQEQNEDLGEIKLPYKAINALVSTTTLRSGFISENNRNVPTSSDTLYNYSEKGNNLNKTLPLLKSTEINQIIVTTQTPTLRISNDNYEQSIKQYIGEDFGGPKQTQKFNTLTGYFY